MLDKLKGKLTLKKSRETFEQTAAEFAAECRMKGKNNKRNLKKY
jgi:hypothetical protein